MPSPVLKRGDTVGEGLNLQRWRVARKIGEGQFAEVYEVVDTFQADRKLALKLDRVLEVKTVEREARVLKRLQPCPCVVRLLEHGSHGQRGFMVMELLGMNVADSRKSCTRDGCWDAATARAIGRHLLDAIAGMHQLGFIHRDVKPANFAITPRFAAVNEGAWHVIDFGLARRYVDDAGLVLPPRPEAAFRGSTSYASLAAHDGEDLGRRDDLWSWLYILVEMLTGTLPWRTTDEVRDREKVVRIKRDCLADPQRLGGGAPLPHALARVSEHLAGLAFEADPDYALLRQCLDDLVHDAASAAAHGVAAQPSGLEEIADTPLSPPSEVFADTPLSPPLEALAPRQPASWTATASAPVDLSSGMAPAAPASADAARESGATASSALTPPAQLAGAKRPRPNDGRASPSRSSPAERDTRSGSLDANRHTRSRVEHSNGGSRPWADGQHRSRHHSRSASRSRSLSRSASLDGRGRDTRGSGRGRSRSPEGAPSRADDCGRSQDRSRDRSRGRSQDRDLERDRQPRSPADRDPRDREPRERDMRGDYSSSRRAGSYDRRDRLSERERAGETVRDSDRGRYRDSVSARRDERPAPARLPAAAARDDYTMDTARCKHVHKYVTRIKQGEMSDNAKDCKAQLKLISLTEGLGLAAYVIDNIVDEVSSRDAEQMAALLGELEEYVWAQKQRAKQRAKRR